MPLSGLVVTQMTTSSLNAPRHLERTILLQATLHIFQIDGSKQKLSRHDGSWKSSLRCSTAKSSHSQIQLSGMLIVAMDLWLRCTHLPATLIPEKKPHENCFPHSDFYFAVDCDGCICRF